MMWFISSKAFQITAFEPNTQLFSKYMTGEFVLWKLVIHGTSVYAFRKDICSSMFWDRTPHIHFLSLGGKDKGVFLCDGGQSPTFSHKKRFPKAERVGKCFLLVRRWLCVANFRIGQEVDEEWAERPFRICCLLTGKAFTKWNDPCLAVAAYIIMLSLRCLRGSFNYRWFVVSKELRVQPKARSYRCCEGCALFSIWLMNS